MTRRRSTYRFSPRTGRGACSRTYGSFHLPMGADSISRVTIRGAGTAARARWPTRISAPGKGFHPTFYLERHYWGLGSYRLDWLFVKTALPSGGVNLFRPSQPQTLSYFNELGKERLSDHRAITVELERSPDGSDK